MSSHSIQRNYSNQWRSVRTSGMHIDTLLQYQHDTKCQFTNNRLTERTSSLPRLNLWYAALSRGDKASPAHESNFHKISTRMPRGRSEMEDFRSRDDETLCVLNHFTWSRGRWRAKPDIRAIYHMIREIQLSIRLYIVGFWTPSHCHMSISNRCQ